MGDAPKHVERLMVQDAPIQEARRRRVEEVVKDRETAELLKPWYPTWCKRPGFHDEYLEAFNRPNVHLVDMSTTKGDLRGGETGLRVGEHGEEVPLDVVVLATGFRDPSVSGDPGVNANMTITGKDGLTLDKKWNEKGAGSLHGYVTSSFPNFFMQNTLYAAASPNFTGSLGMYQYDFNPLPSLSLTHMHSSDIQAQQIAYVISTALQRVENPQKLAIDVDQDTEEAWVAECQKYTGWMAPVAMCTPSQLNAEGAAAKLGAKQGPGRFAMYFKGQPAFRDLMNAWRADGKMEGIVLRS